MKKLHLVLVLFCICLSITVFALTAQTQQLLDSELQPKVSEPLLELENTKNIPEKAQNAPEATSTPHTLVGSYYTLENNIDAKLLLNNKGKDILEVRPTLYNSQGQQQEIPPVLVEPQSFRFINLQDWAAIGGDSFKSGNIKLFHTGKDLVLGAQIYLTDEAHSLGFEEKLAEKTKFDSRRQEAVWWMPSNQADVQVIVTNTTDELLSFTGTLAKKPNHTGDPQNFQLAAHETKVLDLWQVFTDGDQFANSAIAGLSLQHAAVKDALLARVMVKETNLGYSNVVQFSNPGGGKSAEYQGVGFQIEDVAGEQMTPVIVARNTGCETAMITAKIPYTRVDGTKSNITLPQEQLKSGEMRLLNVQSIIKRVREEQIKIASLEIEYNTAPGSVIVAAHSVSDNHNQVFRVPMWDPLGQRSPTGGYPWRIEGSSQTETYIKNITDQEEDYVAFLLWENGGIYMIGRKPIAGHETVHIDVKKLRDEQIPDERGRTIPLSVSSGQLQWTLRRADKLDDEDVRANLALIGRSEQVDITKGIVNNYSCQNCCQGNFVAGYIEPANLSQTGPIDVGSTRIYIAVEEDQTCYGYQYAYGEPCRDGGNECHLADAGWNTSNSNVATVYNGHVTGVNNGSAEISATWYIRRLYMNPCPPYGTLSLNGEEFECSEAKGKDVITEKKNPDRHIKPNIAACGTCFGRGSYYTAYKTVFVGGGTTQPQVASIRAEIPSTGAASPGAFTTTNTSTAFASDSNDLMVVFKGSDNVSIQAEGVNPTSAGSQLKWQLERGDTVEPGLPTLSSQVGQYITLTPSSAGNFKLICYYDSNNNGTFDNGEELRVLRFVIVRIFVGSCGVTNDNVFTGTILGESVQADTSPITRTCVVSLEGGGTSKNIGLDKVKMGLITNIYNQSLEVNYQPGKFIITHNGILPHLYKDEAFPTPLNGGSSVFRDDNNDTGALREISYESQESTTLFEQTHPTTGTNWVSSVGGPKFDEFISGYSETFPNHYVVVAKVRLEIFFTGIANENLEWINNGANVFLNGPNTNFADFDITVNNDPNSPQGGSVTSGRYITTSSNQPLNVDTLYRGTISYPQE